jgi:hypothetical protein
MQFGLVICIVDQQLDIRYGAPPKDFLGPMRLHSLYVVIDGPDTEVAAVDSIAIKC